MDDRTLMPVVKMSRAEVLALFPPRDAVRREMKRRDEALRLYEPEALVLCRMPDILDPVVFWCRFCRVTLEPFAHA